MQNGIMLLSDVGENGYPNVYASFGDAGILGFSISEIFSETLDTDNDGWPDYNIRIVIPASSLSGSGTQIRVTFEAGAAGALGLQLAYIGHAASSGDAYDFDGNQVKLTFSGSDSVDISAGGTITSDFSSFSYDNTKNLVVSYDVKNDTAYDTLRALSSSVCDRYYNSSPNAGTTDVSGYASASGINYSIKSVEIK